MNVLAKNFYVESIELILICSVFGFITSSIAIKKKFYDLPCSLSLLPIKLSFLHVLACFCIYLINSSLLAPFVLKHLAFLRFPLPAVAAWVQLLVMCFSLFLLLVFCSLSVPKGFGKIWKDNQRSSLIKDISIGALTWVLAFPLVAIVEQIADLVIYALFGVTTYEQEAVRYLKMALQSPSQLVTALLLILGAAPFLEELLFRGLLQTWLKKHLGRKASILLASLCFACFHLSASHGVGNLSLIPSLFAFSCFLGFIYEKQRSLGASISLHMTFNLISALRILFSIAI